MEKLDLVQGKLLPTLLRFTIPILFSILLQTTYGTVDLLIVGRYATVGDLSAVTIGSQIMQSITSMFTGLAMGTTILIGKFMGSREREKITEVVGVSILLFTLFSCIITVILIVFHPQIALYMKTPEEAIVQCEIYLLISGLGTIFIVYYNLIASIFRGIGDSKTPLFTVFIACCINICLDIIFVIYFKMGATGAALATIIAQVSSVVSSYIFLKNKDLPFDISSKILKYEGKVAINILKLGIPVALQGVLVSISFLAITAIVNTFGVSASAGVGIVEKITGIIMVVPIAFMQSLSAFVAQNIGANQLKRAEQGLFYSISLSLLFGCCTAYLCAFHGDLLTSVFIKDDPDTTAAALLYLQSYAFDCVFVAIMFSYSGYFNGRGKTAFVMLQAIFGACFIRIPLAYYMSSLNNTNLFYIGLATPTSTFIQIFMCIFYYVYESRKREKECLLP